MTIRPIDMRNLAFLALLAISPAANAAITGSIIDSDAKPVAGATIRAYASEDSAALRARLLAGKLEREPVAAAQSSDNGSFSIDVKATPAVDLVIEAPGHARTSFATVDGDDLGAIVLGPPPTRKVLVTSGGKPVANAIVVSGLDISKTGVSGDVPALGGGSLFVVHPDYAIGTRRDAPNATPAEVYEIKLSRGVSVRGRVVNAAAPVAHAIVSINGWPLGESADDGTFAITHAPENWQSISAVRGNDAGAVTRSKAASVEIRIAPAAVFAGTVRDTKSGAVVAGARMLLAAPDDSSVSESAVSDAKGKFTFAPLLPHAYQISGMHPAYAIESAAVSVPRTSARAFAAQPFGRARGRVVDEEKKPVVAASVTSPSFNGARSRTSLTNATGEFVLRMMPSPSTFATPIYASKRDYVNGMSAPRKWQPGETRDDVVITLAHGFVAKVRVIDQQRQPVPKVFVNVTRTGEDGRQGFSTQAGCADPLRPDCHLTGADGFVSVRTVEGKHAVFVTGGDVAPKRVPNQMLTARSEAVVVQVDRGVQISGRVVRADGTPVPDAIVEMRTTLMPRSATSDADGAFTLTGIPTGSASVTAFSSDRHLSSAAVTVTAPAKNVTITMPRGARIEGRILDRATQQPITDFAIGLPSRGGAGASSAPQQFHADDGHYAIDNVSPGMTQISVRAAGYVPGSRGDITAEDGKTVSGIDVQLDRGATVSGRATSSGVPASGVQVQVIATGMPFSGGTTTDADGSYTIDGVAEGDRTIQFQKSGFIVLRKPVQVTAGKEAHLDVELDPGRELRGRVVDRTGGGIAGANVAINGSNNQPNSSAPTEGDGAFVIQGLPDGHYNLTARKDGYVSGNANDVDVPQTQPLTFTLDSGATITGRVTGLSPDDLAQVTVSASGGSSRNQTDVDAAGNFTMHGLPDGRVRVDAMLSSPGHRRMASPKTIVVENGTAPPVELSFDEGMTVSGHVTHAGVAVSNGAVTFIPTSQTTQRPSAPVGGVVGPVGGVVGGVVTSVTTSPSPDRQVATAMISPDGSYVATGITSGDYGVRVNWPGLAFQTKYTASGSGTFDIDIHGALLRGHVVDATSGAPVVNAQISVSTRALGFGISGTSDSDGHFTIDSLIDATYDLRVTREPYSAATQQLVVSGGTVPEVEVRLEQAPAVTLHIVDSVTGAPVDANVVVSTAAHTNASQTTRIDTGVYKTWLLPGSYNAGVFAGFYVPNTTSFTTPPAEVRIAIVHGGRLIIMAKSAQQVRLEQPGPRILGPIHEGMNGPYQAMAPGSYVLSALDKNGSVVRSMPVTIVAGETATIQLP